MQYYNAGSLFAEFSTKASAHGKTVSIIHLWGMLACDTTSHPLTNLPWLFAWLAIALAIFGHVWTHTSNLVAATVGAYLCISLPYLHIHAVLAGYADIWIALTFVLGVLLLGDYAREPHPGLIAVTMFYIVACTSMKESGLLSGGCLLALLVWNLASRSLLKRAKVTYTGIAVAAMLVVAAIYILPLLLNMPFIERIIWSQAELRTPDILTLPRAYSYRSVTVPLVDSLYLFSQLHLLAPLFCITIALVILRRQWQLLTKTSVWAVTLGGSLTWLYFSFADYAGAIEHTGLMRAHISLMPVAVFWCVISWAQLVESHRTNQKSPNFVPSNSISRNNRHVR
jgi:hypothetical protein